MPFVEILEGVVYFSGVAEEAFGHLPRLPLQLWIVVVRMAVVGLPPDCCLITLLLVVVGMVVRVMGRI